MLRIEVGEVYKAERVRNGYGANGDWELVVVKSGRDSITVWTTNVPSGVQEGGEFRVKSIKSFTKKKVPYKDGKICRDRGDRNVEWREEVDCNAELEAVGFSEAPFDFDDAEDLFGDNPFDNDDDLPL